jgi:hypothetical protein
MAPIIGRKKYFLVGHLSNPYCSQAATLLASNFRAMASGYQINCWFHGPRYREQALHDRIEWQNLPSQESLTRITYSWNKSLSGKRACWLVTFALNTQLELSDTEGSFPETQLARMRCSLWPKTAKTIPKDGNAQVGHAKGERTLTSTPTLCRAALLVVFLIGIAQCNGYSCRKKQSTEQKAESQAIQLKTTMIHAPSFSAGLTSTQTLEASLSGYYTLEKGSQIANVRIVGKRSYRRRLTVIESTTNHPSKLFIDSEFDRREQQESGTPTWVLWGRVGGISSFNDHYPHSGRQYELPIPERELSNLADKLTFFYPTNHIPSPAKETLYLGHSLVDFDYGFTIIHPPGKVAVGEVGPHQLGVRLLPILKKILNSVENKSGDIDRTYYDVNLSLLEIQSTPTEQRITYAVRISAIAFPNKVPLVNRSAKAHEPFHGEVSFDQHGLIQSLAINGNVPCYLITMNYLLQGNESFQVRMKWDYRK